jgi:hypothetical protein
MKVCSIVRGDNELVSGGPTTALFKLSTTPSKGYRADVASEENRRTGAAEVLETWLAEEKFRLSL